MKRVKTNQDLGDLPLVKEKALDFCKKVRLQKALEHSVELIEKENYEKIIDEIPTSLLRIFYLFPLEKQGKTGYLCI